MNIIITKRLNIKPTPIIFEKYLLKYCCIEKQFFITKKCIEIKLID